MKYIVEVKYTNPAHEHVSLRRRVDTVRRVVEAADEAEAINRVTRQQRSLGYMIKEAEVVHNGGEGGAIITNNEPKKKKIVGDEGETEIKKEPVKEEAKEETAEDVTEAAKDWKRAFGAVATKNLNKDIGPLRNKTSRLRFVGMQPAIDATPRVTAAVAKKGAYSEEVESVEEDRAMSAAIAGGSVGSKILTGKMDPNFGYAANKMPPHLKAAQAKSDALSKVVKRPQAGTLAAMKKEEVEEVDEARKMSRVEWRVGTESEVDKNNKKIFDKLSKTDPEKAAAFHANLLRMKKKDVKEAVEDKKAGKGRKAAERMINLAKGKKNQVNLEPSVDPYKHHQPTTGK